MKRGDWQFEYVKRRLGDGIFVPHREIEAFVKALDEEPAAPPPERIVVSELALAAWTGGRSAQDGLRAAFKVMLANTLTRPGVVWANPHEPANIYYLLTGEEMP